MQTVSSARRTCIRLLSAVECTAMVLISISRQARSMRSAISPRLAMSTFIQDGHVVASDESAGRRRVRRWQTGAVEFHRFTV